MTKSIGSQSQFILYTVVICSLLCASSYCSTVFKTYPDYKIYTGVTSATCVKISSDQSYVAVGYYNGTLYVYDTYGSYRYSMYGHNSTIIDIEYMAGVGWITLDSSGKAIRWSTSGSLQWTWNLTSNVIDMSIPWNTYGYTYVAFNFGTYVAEYYTGVNSNTPTKYYYPQTYTTFVQIQYSGSYTNLYVATNTSYIQSYYCNTGNYSGYYFYIYYQAKDFATLSNGDMVVFNNYYVYKFSSISSYTYYSYSYSGNVIAASMRDSWTPVYITTYVNSSYYMYVFDKSMYYTQSLNYMNYYIRAIDASDKYLVAVDSYGYLSINTYGTDWVPYNTDFPLWAVLLIVFGGFTLCVVGIVVAVVRTRKRRQAMALNNYANINNENQPYIASNQGFNSNQPYQAPQQGAWMANQNQNQGYLPPQQQGAYQAPNNPYQANQPSNWS